MDEIGQRLKDCADACISAYAAWMNSKSDVSARENLQEAVHELRKVSARLEIEMAVSERQEMSQRPIPVPPHRASRRREGGSDLPDFITDGNTRDEEGGNSRPQQQRQQGQGGGVRRMGGGGMRRPNPSSQSGSPSEE